MPYCSVVSLYFIHSCTLFLVYTCCNPMPGSGFDVNPSEITITNRFGIEAFFLPSRGSRSGGVFLLLLRFNDGMSLLLRLLDAGGKRLHVLDEGLGLCGVVGNQVHLKPSRARHIFLEFSSVRSRKEKKATDDGAQSNAMRSNATPSICHAHAPWLGVRRALRTTSASPLLPA